MPDPSHDDIKQDLLTNPRYAALFAPYHPEAVARFVSDYANRKHDWQYWGPKAEFDQTEALSQLSEAAYCRLWDIQRKKLFDLQCRWRAGQITLPGIGCTCDFAAHDVAIENCPVLRHEFELHISRKCPVLNLRTSAQYGRANTDRTNRVHQRPKT